MAIFDYNNRISFDLPTDYIFERGIDRKGQELVKIMTGEDGEGDYDFYCFIDVIKYDSKSPDSLKILEFAEITDSSKLICISASPKVYIKATRSSYSVFGNVYNTFELTGQITISNGMVLELSNRSMDNDEGFIDEATAIQRFYKVLTSVCVDGKKLQFDMSSSKDLEAKLKSNAEKEIKDVTPNIQVNFSFGNDTETYDTSSNVPENNSNTGMPFSEQEVLDKGPACGIWLMLGQITSLCKNTEYFTEEDIEIINEGLTTHEFLISAILQRDPALYELALESKKVAASFILGVLSNNGQKAISIFQRAFEMQIPANFEKAFILISLFFEIPYEPAASLPFERKQEIMKDCCGFVNSMQVILSMEGYHFDLPSYCKADNVSVYCVDKQPKDGLQIASEQNVDTEELDENQFVVTQGDPDAEVKGNQLVRYNNKEVENIRISGKFKIIGTYAFLGAEKLESLIVEEGVEEIKDLAFSGCNNLIKISLPSTLRKIGKDAFGFCESLEEIRIPEGVTQIGNGAFNFCRKLKTVYLPKSLERIVGGAWLIARDAELYVHKGSYAEEYVTKKYKFSKINTI